MRRLSIALLSIISIVFYVGCSGIEKPVAGGLFRENSEGLRRSQTHLWGYFEVSIDTEAKSVSVIPIRNAMFTANVVNFLNSNPTNMSFHINGVHTEPGYTDVDIDVSLRHPFPGLPQYNGYDVRGVFMGDGSGTVQTTGVIYPVLGTDQFMLNDPIDNSGGPDGYTRWFNKTEFNGGMPLLSYTQGKMASPKFNGTATLCPYKYFADGLGKNDDLWTWLNSPSNSNKNSVFSAGTQNTRNYYIRFPNTKGIVFGYAVIANWSGPEPQNHPANAPEAIAIMVEDMSNVYYVNPDNKGGSLKLNINVWDWDSHPSSGTGVMEDYTLFIESTVLSSPYKFNPAEMTPTGGGEHYSTYHVEIAADNIKGTHGNEYWIIAQDSSLNYGNDFGVPNLAQNEKLTAYFRYDLKVGSEPGNQPPVCDLKVVTPMPAKGWMQVAVEFNASGSYDPEGTALTYQWDFDGDGIYNENPDDSYSGPPENPTHIYKSSYYGIVRLKLTDQAQISTICSTSALNVTVLTSCPSTAMPTGMPTPYSVSFSNTARSGITRAFGSGGKEYFIGHKRDYYGYRYGFYALDKSGNLVHDYMSPPQANYPPTLQGMACTSNNRIYVITYTQYNYYDYVLYYVDFNETSGFSGLLQTAPMPSISPWYFVKICVDQNDNPVALVGQNNQLAIKHWNGSSWKHINILDSATMYAECGYWHNGIEDIAYQPIKDTYWITNRYHGYTPNYDGFPTLYVIKSDGTTAWKDSNIFPSCPPYTQYSVGVEIDVWKPECRTLVAITCGSTGSAVIPTRYIRYDPEGNVTGAQTMGNTAYRYELGNGTIINSGSEAWFCAPLNLSGSNIGIIKIPDW